MKKITLVTLTTCILSVGLCAENQTEENVLTRLYSGYLTVTTYDQALNVINGTDWRIGGAIELPTTIGTIKALSVFNNNLSITGYSLQMGRLQFGKIARPMTYHRPWPVSSASHFEPASIGTMPGSSLGIDYFLQGKITNFRIAIHETKNTNNQSIPELGLSGQLKGVVRLSTCVNREIVSAAASYNGTRLSTTIYGTTNSTLTNFINYYIDEKTALFSDFVYCPQGIEKYEVGITTDLAGIIGKTPANILLGGGIVYRDPAVDPMLPELSFNLYIFLTKTYDRK